MKRKRRRQRQKNVSVKFGVRQRKKITGKTNNNLNVKRWNQNAMMLGPNMPYLPKMYDFRFFSINLVNFSYQHLLEYLPLIPHDDKPILLIYLLNVFAKIQ